MRYITKFCTLIFFLSCATSHLASARSRNERAYLEYLHSLRQEYSSQEPCTAERHTYKTLKKVDGDTPPGRHLNEKIDEALAEMVHKNLSTQKVECYTIQVHIGTNRSMAFAIFEKIRRLFPKVYIEHLDSNYVVRVDKKLNRLELSSEYVQMLKIFSNISVRSIFAFKDEIYATNLCCIAEIICEADLGH